MVAENLEMTRRALKSGQGTVPAGETGQLERAEGATAKDDIQSGQGLRLQPYLAIASAEHKQHDEGVAPVEIFEDARQRKVRLESTKAGLPSAAKASSMTRALPGESAESTKAPGS
jgi:hypothetical protein